MLGTERGCDRSCGAWRKVGMVIKGQEKGFCGAGTSVF